MGKYDEYKRGWADGIAHAYRIVIESGLKDLKDYMRIHGALNYPLKMTPKEYELATEATKRVLSNTMTVVWLSILSDDFGFGEKRLKRAVAGVNKFACYLTNGWLYWMDVVDELKKKHNIDILLSDEGSPDWKKYKRPDAEDVYGGWPSMIDREEWQHVLSLAKCRDVSGRILDGSGGEVARYDDECEKLECYDFLRGILYERGIEVEAR